MKSVTNNVDTHDSQSYKNPVSAIKILKSAYAQIETKFYKEINDLDRKYIGFYHVFAL